MPVDYIFKPYNLIFPELFKKERDRLKEFLTGAYRIEHFGSTAVPGLGGKGIIDIYIIAQKNNFEQIFISLEKAGYEARPNSNTAERFVYVRELVDKKGQKERYHLHITFEGSYEHVKDLALRDYLKSHPEDAQEYAEIKQKAAEKANNSKDVYIKTKEPIIQKILKKALKL